MEKLMLDVSQAEELKFAFRKFGWTNQQIKKLCEGNILGEVLKVINGDAEIIMLPFEVTMDVYLAEFYGDDNLREIEKEKNRIKKLSEIPIDLDKDPYLPKNFSSVHEHRKMGTYKLDFDKILLCQSDKQLNGGRDGSLMSSLKKKLVFNANLLDFLLHYPELIPKEWEYKYIYFWGTIYIDGGDAKVVRCLYYRNGKWRSGYKEIGGLSMFGNETYAVIQAEKD